MPETTQFGGQEELYGEGSLKANTILMARYKILSAIGGGGQGAVYQGRDLNFPDAKRLVAIKEMHYPSGDPSVRSVTLKTFQREANILATLAHPAIPKIFDFFDQNNRAYLVMEYVNGSDLELLLNKTRELPIDKIVEWAIDLCDVLQYLHSHQPEPIIFRDVKPANIMIDSLGKVRLIDFGIAKIFVSGVKNTMIGTEGYSAPEQYKGDVNPLSDIYSLGATLHHIITRKDPRLEPPFSFDERPIEDFNNDVTPQLAAIISKSLHMDPAERYQSCSEMKEALLQYRYQPTVAVIGNGGDATAASPGLTDDLFGDGFDLGGNIEPRWVFKTEDEIRGSPAIFRDFAYVGSYDTNIWAVNTEDGEFRWKYATEAGIAASPVVDRDNRLVVFGSEDHTFNALEYDTGRIVWSYTTNDRIRSTATIAHDHVFFGSDDGRIYSLAAANGRYLWEYDMGAPVRSRPYVTREMVIAGCESGELVGIELSGNRKWSYRVRRAITASPFIDEIENICYFGSMDGYVYAMDASSGYSMWRFRTNGPIISTVEMEGALIFFGSADGNFYAINSENAKEKWRFGIEKPIVASPLVHEGRVYFGGTDGVFYCLETKTGKEIWRFETNAAITSAPFITENMILFGSMDHTLYALPLVVG